MDTPNFRKFPRADTTEIETDHNQWALHGHAFDYDLKPLRFAAYHDNPERKPGPGYYDEYIPVSHDVPKGEIIGKKITHRTRECPNCKVSARNVHGDVMCPDCGLIVHESVEMVRDGKATGRTEGHAGGEYNE